MKILEEKGPRALSIDKLAQQTNKTKGSFYHHFKSRRQYIKDLLRYHEIKVNVEVLHIVDQESGQIDRLKKLTELVFQISSRLELVIRAWALYEPIVKESQDRIDQKRLEYLEEIYQSDGRSKARAQAAAYRNYSIYIGIQQLRHLHDEKRFKNILKDIFFM